MPVKTGEFQRLVADVAVRLGEQGAGTLSWEVIDKGTDFPGLYLKAGNGVTLYIRPDWRDESKLEISTSLDPELGRLMRYQQDRPGEIRVSASKTATQIAKDIYRRILAAATEELAKAYQLQEDSDATYAERRGDAETIAAAMGGAAIYDARKDAAERGYSTGDESRMEVNVSVLQRDFFGKFDIGYRGSCSIELRSVPTELAVLIAQAIATYEGK